MIGDRLRDRPRRRPPLEGRGRSVLIAALSLATLLIAAFYLTTPGIASCDDCAPHPLLQTLYDVVSIATVAIAAYFCALYVVGLRNAAADPPRPSDRPPLFVLMTPAHNEELVIEATVKRMRSLQVPGGRMLALILNDGSSDRTSEVALAAAEGDERILVLDRLPAIAGQGKGAVLNHGYQIVDRLCEWGDTRLQGATADEIVICVVDADGWMRDDALMKVGPYFDDPQVGAVQIPVRMYNARKNLLAAMQDIEFIAFSILIQGGRDRIGSALLGGNGQFVRLSALRSVGRMPWTKSLTEDLDLGLHLAVRGWRIRMCPHTVVAQQAVTDARRLLRQRTRWVQGHYTCWSHLPALWRARGLRPLVRLDLSAHLVLATLVLLVAAQALLGIAGFAGLFALDRSVMAKLIGDDTAFRVFVVLASSGPLALIGLAYQRAAVSFGGSGDLRLPVWSLPGMFLAFTAYTYFWGLPCTARALARMTRREDGWAKTARDPVTAPSTTPEPTFA